MQGCCLARFGPGWIFSGSPGQRICGLEQVAQTEVRQDGADYNRCFEKWQELIAWILKAPPRRASKISNKLLCL